MNYYNENDPFAAAWLRELIKAGYIPVGEVDERSIEDVKPSDLRGYTQCHFFAGIAGWSRALQLANWPSDRPVWTGSCPCQPFSTAGKGGGFTDERHLWPAWCHLIQQCKPATIFGEQVASPDGLKWFDLVSTDLEGSGYAVGAADLCAAGVGAPHIRQRLYWVADSVSAGRSEGRPWPGSGSVTGRCEPGQLGELRRLAQPQGEQHDRNWATWDRRSEFANSSILEHPNLPNEDKRPSSGQQPVHQLSYWTAADWIDCQDGKQRPVESQPQQMADGSTETLGRVRHESIAELEKEVAHAFPSDADARKTMQDLWRALSQEAVRGWSFGRPTGVHEAPVLLAFVRQLANQGWAIAQGIPRPSEEVAKTQLRSVWVPESVARASCERGLAEQFPSQYSDSVHLLSSILARHAQANWTEAFDTYARIGFPLTFGAPNRVGRLRGYGNAIVPQVAKAFIESYMSIDIPAWNA